MTPLDKLDVEALRALYRSLEAEHAAARKAGLKLNIARGKPSAAQLDLSAAMLSRSMVDDWTTAAGDDARNYGGDPQGLIELREIFSPVLGVPPKQIVAGGNSSLTMMHECLVWGLLKGVPGGKAPWVETGDRAFLCPAPGYEVHQRLADEFGFRLLPVPVTPDGPDMDTVEKLVADESVKGMWCVPTYANPTGEIYSDAVVERLASMRTGAPDFRLFWDEAYVLHHLGAERRSAANIIDATLKAGHPDRALVFSSTSKMTFAGGGVGFLAASPANIAWYTERALRRGGGPDKLNQLRHVRFLRDTENLAGLMAAHRTLLAPKFDAVIGALDRRMDGLGAATWSRPQGGYFINIETIPGAAQRAVELAQEAGVSLTVAGSTWPHGEDPQDSNIRIAPSYADIEDIKIAADVIALSILLAAAEKVLRLNTSRSDQAV
nr:aminotransferase [uncultured Shinella sp.]